MLRVSPICPESRNCSTELDVPSIHSVGDKKAPREENPNQEELWALLGGHQVKIPGDPLYHFISYL